MADKAISDLTQALQITDEDLFVLQQNGEAKKLKGRQVVQYAKDSVAAEVQGVKEYADTAKASADAAAKNATRAESAAQGIDDKVAAADASAKAAASSAAAAAASATGVDEKVQAAQTAADNAAKSETAAKAAQTAAANAQSAAETAKTDAQTAKLDAQKAWEDAERAKNDASGSADSARQESANAFENALNAQNAKTDAETAKTDAQAARDSIVNMIVEAVTLASGSDATVSKSVVDNVFKLAFGIPRGNPGADAPTITGITIRQTDYHMIVSLSDGTTYDAGYCRGAAGAGSGDMIAAVYDPQGKQLDIYKYVDDEIAKIPTPDVSLQIKAHNENQDAHPYIRGLIPTKTSQLDNDSGYLTDVSGKLDKPANDAIATAGQLLTKTADGQEWQDREKDIFIVTITDTVPGDGYASNPAPDEILAAAQAGKVIELNYGGQKYFCAYIYVSAETGEAGFQFTSSGATTDALTIMAFALERESRNAQWHWSYTSNSTSQLLNSNGNSSDTTVGFTVASTRTALESGTKLAILMGKIAKWFNDLGWLAFKDTVTTNDVSSAIKASLSRADSALQSVSKNDAIATAGQLLTKTADGQEWKDREKDVFVVNMTTSNGSTIEPADKTFEEIQAAYIAGKVVIARLYFGPLSKSFDCRMTNFARDSTIVFENSSGSQSLEIRVQPEKIALSFFNVQSQINATGILKGNGSGGVSAATADVDYAMVPTTRKVTLTASGWNSSTKQQTVTCSGVLSDATKQLLIPTPVNTAAGNPYDEASIQMVAQGANSVTFYADTVPTVGIDVYVTIYPINYLG